VAVSQTEDLLKVMVANPTMIDAYRAGVPGNGKSFPDGSKIAKIEWKPKKHTEAPFSVRIPDALQDVSSSLRTRKNSRALRDGHMPRSTMPPRVGHVQARCDRRRHLRLDVPYESGGQGLHLHGVRKR